MKKQVEIIKVKAHDLDPNKVYVIEIDPRTITREEAMGIREELSNLGVKGVIIFSSIDSVRVKEVI